MKRQTTVYWTRPKTTTNIWDYPENTSNSFLHMYIVECTTDRVSFTPNLHQEDQWSTTPSLIPPILWHSRSRPVGTTPIVQIGVSVKSYENTVSLRYPNWMTGLSAIHHIPESYPYKTSPCSTLLPFSTYTGRRIWHSTLNVPYGLEISSSYSTTQPISTKLSWSYKMRRGIPFE